LFIGFRSRRKKSLRGLDFWKKEFVCNAQLQSPETFPFFVVGNRSDLVKQRTVSLEEANDWCRAHGGLRYMETSAKTGANVDKVFKTLVAEVLRQNTHTKTILSKQPDSLELELKSSPETDEKKRFRCC